MLKREVLNTIEKYDMIGKGDQVVLGLSGGPDSVCLFHVLREIGKEMGFSLFAVHVNHMMRQETNFRDEKFVKLLCEKHQIPLRVFHVDCRAEARNEGISTEEAGRNARYDAFSEVADVILNEIAEDGGRVSIAVAHNGDDQAETLMYRLIRGTGTDGLAGMGHVRAHGKHRVIRPLLDVSRREIEEYLKSNSLEYVVDETNEKPIYARNRIRLELLPYIRANYNQNISAGLRRLADIAACDRDYMWQQADREYESIRIKESHGERVLDRKGLAQIHEALRHRVILKGLAEIGLEADVSHERLKAMDDALGADGRTRVIELPRGYRVTVAYDRVYLRSCDVGYDGDIRFDGNGAGMEIEAKIVDVTDENCRQKDANVQSEERLPGDVCGDMVLDADKVACETGIELDRLTGMVVARNRMAGDYIPLNGGSKSLRKLMGEMKIPADIRDSVPLVAAGNCILCIETHDGRRRYAETLKATVDSKHKLIVKFV